MTSCFKNRFSNLFFKVFYDGANYYGSQRQPNLETVEGKVLGAIRRLKVKVLNFSSASRTDRFVHSIGQTFNVVLEGPLNVKEFIRGLLKFLPEDIIPWAFRVLNSDFHPRYSPVYRHYAYVEDSVDLEVLRGVLKVFIGTYNYKCFTSLKAWQDPWRRIVKIRASSVKGRVLIEFIGDSFLKHMIRRIIGLTRACVRGDISISQIASFLKGEDCKSLANVELGEPHRLILVNVRYPFSFTLYVEGLSRVLEYLGRARMGGLSDVLSQILSSQLYELL